MALSSRKSRYLASGVGLLLVAVTLSAQLGWVPWLDKLYQRLELIVYDLRMEAHLPAQVEPDRRIIIVDIDENALQQLGQWPWPRDQIARLVAELHEVGAVMVAFDVLFAEKERNPVGMVLSRLDNGQNHEALKLALMDLRPSMDADAVLAKRLSQSEVVLGYSFDREGRAVSGQLPAPLTLDNQSIVKSLALTSAAGYSAPLPQLTNAASAAGFFSIHPDADGVIRRAALIKRYDNKLFGSLALETVRRYMFLQKLTLHTGAIDGAEHIEFLQLDNALTIPTDGEGRMLIPYRGHVGSFPYVSAAEVLAGKADPELFAGAIVLVGTTAAGLYDMRATPLDATYPGVEVHANLIAAMLDNHHLVVPAWARGANLTFGLVVGLILALLMPRVPVTGLLLLSVGAGITVVAVTAFMWSHYGLVLDLAGPLLMVGVLSVGNLSWGFFFESLNRHRLKEMFGQYVPPELVEKMSDRPDDFDVEGKARELSVLFADIRGFTSISESLSAEELKRFLNRFFTPMTRVIFNHRGTIDKYVGDMVMAFWGAPVEDDEHAIHAIEAALEMQQMVQQLKAEFVQEGWPEVSIGIGINSGKMSVGDMGSEYRRSYTVLGDAVNLASRLEGVTKYYGVDVVVGDHTRKLAAERFIFRELDRVRVKGKQEAVQVYQPVCRREDATDEVLYEVAMLDEALVAYRLCHWDEAERLFALLQQSQPAFQLYALYQQRISKLREQALDESWDGVYIRTQK